MHEYWPAGLARKLCEGTVEAISRICSSSGHSAAKILERRGLTESSDDMLGDCCSCIRDAGVSCIGAILIHGGKYFYAIPRASVTLVFPSVGEDHSPAEGLDTTTHLINVR